MPKTEDRRRKTLGPKTDSGGRSPKTEDREDRDGDEDGDEDGRRRPEDRRRKTEDWKTGPWNTATKKRHIMGRLFLSACNSLLTLHYHNMH